MNTDKQIADSMTRFLMGDSEVALQELKDNIDIITPVSNNANTQYAKSHTAYHEYYNKTYKKILSIVRGNI